MQCSLSAFWSREKFVLGAGVYVAAERKREGFRKKTSLSESYQDLFSFFFPYCVFSAETHTRVSLEGLFFFKRCSFDAIVCFAVSLDVAKKKEDWTAPFYFFFFFFFFLGFVFVMKG